MKPGTGIPARAYLIATALSIPMWWIVVAGFRGVLPGDSYLVTVSIFAVALLVMFLVAGALGSFHGWLVEHRSERMRHLRQQIALERLLEGGSKTWEDAA